MPTVNQVNPKIDKTARIFDQFLGIDITVPVNEYDAVNSYLKSVMSSNAAAGRLTVAVFTISQSQSIPVLDLLAQLKKQPGELELTSTLAYYLNNMRSRATLLGINGTVVPNVNAARNVVA